MSNHELSVILHTLISMLASVCVGGAIVLFFQARTNRSKQILGLILLIWGIVYVLRIINDIATGFYSHDHVTHLIMSPAFIISGNFYLLLLLLYPIEIIRPGWLTIKRILKMSIPYLIIVMIYYVGLYIDDEPVLKLTSVDMLRDNIGIFNVWFRFIIVGILLIYFIYTFIFIVRYEKSYMRWCNDNYVTLKEYEITWLLYYGIGILCIDGIYMWIAIEGTFTASITHKIVVLTFFGYAIYNGLFHSNPYSEDFFKETLDENDAINRAILKEDIELTAVRNTHVREQNNDAEAFVNKLNDYKECVEHWLVTEKPYLHPDFKLTDVREFLPLNRSYLSRIFNEGFGESFSNVIRRLRIADAERLLINNPELPINRIGEMTGFSGSSAFNRAFVTSHNGLTPLQYRKKMVKNTITDGI